MTDYARRLEELEFEYENLREENEVLVAEKENALVQYEDARKRWREADEENEWLKTEQPLKLATEHVVYLQARLSTVEAERDEARRMWLAWCDRGELAESELKRAREENERLKGELLVVDGLGRDLQARLSAAEATVYDLEVFKDAYLKAEYEAFGVEQRERLKQAEAVIEATKNYLNSPSWINYAAMRDTTRRYEEEKNA